MTPKALIASVLLMTTALNVPTMADDAPIIGRNTSIIKSDRMTPESLWAMGRIGSVAPSNDGKKAVYNVTYFSVPQNKSHTVVYSMELASKATRLLTESADNERAPQYINGGKTILFLSNHDGSSQLWAMNADGSNRRQLSHVDGGIDEYLLSPDERRIILVREIPDYSVIAKNPDDLSKSSGILINDLMYKHWDHFVTSIPHPFLASFSLEGLGELTDILEGEPYECPLLPFGGVEQLAWSPDGKQIAYTCRKKTGLDYAVSTDSDIYLYDIATGLSRNLCKPAGYIRPATDNTRSFEHQPVNANALDCNMGYDTNPVFSPDGRYVAWLSMERDGYESDRNRLCVYELASGTKRYVTEEFRSDVSTFCWAADSRSLYFTGVWHGTTMVHAVNLDGKIESLTDGDWDYSIVAPLADKKHLLVKRQSMSQADEVYLLNVKSKDITQLTTENEYFYKNLSFGKVESRWIPTTDGQQLLCWVIYPPHFDPNKKYPTLLFCEGGPQSPVSQWWSYRWNFQIMAANDYIIVAPNRRGLPGFGMEWLEEISGDYHGLCQQDLLTSIKAVAAEPYVDADRLGCVGASFGGYSVYWLAGHHDKLFKCFISHDGIYNTQQQYVETEEMWFVNWDLKAAPWNTNDTQAQNGYKNSPHLSVDKWDTPILCIHGMNDYRVMYTQGLSAFNAARMRGIEAQLLLFPDENHWVLKPQNGVLWQRTFFAWLERWLKK